MRMGIKAKIHFSGRYVERPLKTASRSKSKS